MISPEQEEQTNQIASDELRGRNELSEAARRPNLVRNQKPPAICDCRRNDGGFAVCSVEPESMSPYCEKNWPHDPSGYVFLGRAVQEIGSARFGSEWRGGEFVVHEVSPLPKERSLAGSHEYEYALHILQRFRPEIRVAGARRDSDGRLSRLRFTPEQWAIAEELSRQHSERVQASIERRRWVEREVTARCETGDLLTAYRYLLGGEMHPIPSAWWNTEVTRFLMYQLDPRAPFSSASIAENLAWIFVNRDSMDHYLGRHRTGEPMVETPPYLSRYLRLMMAVATELRVTPDNQPKKAVVIASLLRSWPTSLPPSEKLLGAMATLLREPESQLGRGIRARTVKKGGGLGGTDKLTS